MKARYRITCLLGAGAVLALGFRRPDDGLASRQGGRRWRTRFSRRGSRDGYPGGGGRRADLLRRRLPAKPGHRRRDGAGQSPAALMPSDGMRFAAWVALKKSR